MCWRWGWIHYHHLRNKVFERYVAERIFYIRCARKETYCAHVLGVIIQVLGASEFVFFHRSYISS